METLSFILGVAFVVVIAIAIVAVYAFVKVDKVSNKLDNLERSFSQDFGNVYRQINDEVDHIYRRVEDVQREVNSVMDSRFDKLEHKLSNTEKSKQLLKN